MSSSSSSGSSKSSGACECSCECIFSKCECEWTWNAESAEWLTSDSGCASGPYDTSPGFDGEVRFGDCDPADPGSWSCADTIICCPDSVGGNPGTCESTPIDTSPAINGETRNGRCT